MNASQLTFRLRCALRLVLGTALALFIYGGPAYKQLMNGTVHWVPQWVMFSGMALGTMRVHLEVTEPGHKSARTVYWEDYMAEYKPHQVRKAIVVRTESEIRAHGRRICAKEGEGVSLFATADVATRAGWRSVMKGDDDLCQDVQPKRRTKRRTKRRSR